MSVVRTFVKRNGKLKIKEVVEKFPVEQNRVRLSSKTGSAYQRYLDDLRLLFGEEDPQCAKVREYIRGEFDGIPLPYHLDLSEISHVYVLIGIDDHIEDHLRILAGTAKAIIIAMDEDMPPVARVPLLPEQAEIIRQDIKKGGK